MGEIRRAQKPILKQWLSRELVQLFHRYPDRLSAREQQRIQDLIGHDSEIAVHLASILEAGYGVQRTPSASPVEEPGRALCLFVVGDSDPFGCVAELRATPLPGRGRGIQLVNPQADPLLPRALIAAGLAVQRWLTAQGLTHHGRGAYLTYDMPIEIGNIAQAYEGRSIGLAGAVAMLSGLIEQPVPSTCAFTGYVDISGAVYAVDGIQEKVEAAADKGIATIFLPTANLSEVPASYRRIVKGVATLAEVIEHLFDSVRIAACVDRLNGASFGAAVHEEAFEGRASGGEKALISCIGERDPYGDPKFQQISEGPVLTAFRKVMPRAVCLLATPNVTEAGRLTQQELQALVPRSQCEIALEVLEVDDPTDYDALIVEMGSKARGFLQHMEATVGQEKGIEPYLIISSGTPQMHTVWVYLLHAEETLKGTRVLQVREPRFVPEGEERVREVASQYLQIGRL
jgi:hypothetical protein